MEDEILNSIAIEAALAKLSQRDRELILAAFQYRPPDGYEGKWPLTMAEVGKWWGRRWLGEELTEAGARYYRDDIVNRWQGKGRKRRNRRKGRSIA